MSALDDLVNKFKANQGAMPQVNPPAAGKVLEEQTKPEVAGQKPAASASGSLSAATSAAASAPNPAPPGATAAGNQTESEGKQRRTAAVVQAELDQVAAELAQTKTSREKLAAELTEAFAALDKVRAELAGVKEELAKTVAFAEQVVADNAKLSSSDAPRAGDLTVESAAAFLKAKGFGIFTLGAQ